MDWSASPPNFVPECPLARPPERGLRIKPVARWNPMPSTQAATSESPGVSKPEERHILPPPRTRRRERQAGDAVHVVERVVGRVPVAVRHDVDAVLAVVGHR